MSETKKFFVYGTLKVGGHFASNFDKVRVTSSPAILKNHALYNLGWFPGVVPGAGEVVGELHEYSSPESVTLRLDQIEGYKENSPKDSLYLRKTVTVETEEGPVEASAYIFNRSVDSSMVVESGEWDINK